MIKENKVWIKFNTCHNIYINSGLCARKTTRMASS